MLPGRVDSFTKVALDSIVSAGLSEGPTIDLKLEMPLKTPAQKQEFAKDVAAFANRLGGDFLLGVDEKDGAATAPSGLSVSNRDDFELQLQQIVRDTIKPRLAPLEFGYVDGYSNGPVVIVRVRPSPSAPHIANAVGLTGFYGRHGRQNVQMDIDELRRAFQTSEGLLDEAEQFVAARLRVLKHRNASHEDEQKLRYVCHLLPLDVRHSRLALPLKEVADRLRNSLQSDMRLANWGYSVDPVYRQEGLYAWNPQYDPLLVLRNGVLEYSYEAGHREDANKPLMINPHALAWLFKDAQLLIRIAAALEVSFPVLLSVSFIGLSGTHFGILRHQHWIAAGEETFTGESLMLHPVLIEDDSLTKQDLAEQLKPALDLLLQCYGFPEWVIPPELSRRAENPDEA